MSNIFESGYSLYQIIWFFFIYSFLGWCGEVIFQSIKQEKFVNRGFLNGPVCPIYGVGGVLVVVILHRFSNNILFLFIGSIIVTTLIELVTGYFLEKKYHTRWWDYSKVKFNIGGYICPQFSILWGIACVLVIKVGQPLINDFVNWIPKILGIILLIIFGLTFIADWIATAIIVKQLTKDLSRVTEISKAIHKTSDRLAKGLGNTAIDVSNKVKDLKDKKDTKKEEAKEIYTSEIETLQDMYQKAMQELSKKHAYVRRRILKAFPGMRNVDDNNVIQDLKERITQQDTNKKNLKKEKKEKSK